VRRSNTLTGRVAMTLKVRLGGVMARWGRRWGDGGARAVENAGRERERGAGFEEAAGMS
jgi:hypothetical protein